jgi:hypothetical protein
LPKKKKKNLNNLNINSKNVISNDIIIDNSKINYNNNVILNKEKDVYKNYNKIQINIDQYGSIHKNNYKNIFKKNNIYINKFNLNCFKNIIKNEIENIKYSEYNYSENIICKNDGNCNNLKCRYKHINNEINLNDYLRNN